LLSVERPMARAPGERPWVPRTRTHDCAVTWAYLERVTRIELALSAWESDRSAPLGPLTSQDRAPPVAVIDPSLPWLIAR